MNLAQTAAALSLLTLAACASGPQRGPGGGQFRGAGLDVSAQSARILADARKKKAEQGCAAAIPSYRVVASFGLDHETAQYELGACLLEAASGDGAEPALLQEEGLFWLRRAAYAGEPRAQVALADALSGASPASAGIMPNLVEAYGWALLYEDNAAHNLYGLPELQPAVADHFRTQMNADEISDAQAFAAAYREIKMEVFTPPAGESRTGLQRLNEPAGGRPRERRR